MRVGDFAISGGVLVATSGGKLKGILRANGLIKRIIGGTSPLVEDVAVDSFILVVAREEAARNRLPPTTAPKDFVINRA